MGEQGDCNVAQGGGRKLIFHSGELIDNIPTSKNSRSQNTRTCLRDTEVNSKNMN